MARRYRRSNRSGFEGIFGKPPDLQSAQYVQSWSGHYEDAYRAPSVWEPNYNTYAYRSKLSDAWAPWRDPTRFDVATVLAATLTTDEIDGFLRSAVVTNPLVVAPANFAAPQPVMPAFPEEPTDPTAGIVLPPPVLQAIPPAPERPLAKEADYGVLAKPLGFINRTITRGQQRQLDEEYKPKYIEWQKSAQRISELNDRALAEYHAKVERLTTGSEAYQTFLRAKDYWEENQRHLSTSFAAAMARWSAERHKYDAAAVQDARIVASLRADVRAGHSDAIEATATTALRNSRYQEDQPVVHYDSESRILLVQYVLPDFERIEIVEPEKLKALQGKRLAQQKDKASCSLLLRASYDLACIFESSPVEALALNAEVTFVDPTTGHLRTEVVASLFSRLDEIRKLNISSVEPKAAFKALKGVSAGDFSRINPVQPIYAHNKSDGRIVEGRQVIDGLAPDENLAAMHWEEFEHLIRQLFEMEFASNGSEVRVTRASHDSGVDAIVFDPDPIRGGKIVIQAKRYVNTVDASAVRDLFGTVQSEGANKGILITTSSYGPESYEFAKNKPITLLNGENLLWLLQKHGHTFSIDLQAARQLLKERGWL